jgi:Subtilase family
MRWRLSLAIVALCLIVSAAAAASKPPHTRAYWSALSRRVHSGRFSWTQSSTEPYAVCGRPTAHHAECSAIVLPRASATALADSANKRASAVVSSPDTEGGGIGGGYDPADLRSAYDLPSETAGSGQTVGIVDAYDDPDAESDLAQYRSYYGLPACTTANGCFRRVNQSGGTTYPEPNAEWALEISLDLDMVSAACPNCHILLVEANNNLYGPLTTAEDEAVALGATEVSNSWAGEEFSGETELDPYFDHPGVPITVSAGDIAYKVEYPAASPYVISVGGTALERAKNVRGWSEKVWERTGGGCSAYEPKPAWQTDTGCTRRTDNDVAAVAAPGTPVSLFDSYENPNGLSPPGWTLGAGTSASSPLMAGIMALANEHTRSFPGAEALYEEAAQNGTGVLDGVVSGHNGTCGNYLCEAGPGYNGPAGLGSPWGAPVVLPAGQLPTVSQEPQGSWAGKVGSAGYLLAGWDGAQDVSDLPNVTTTLVQGSRYEWAQNTADVRALQSPDGLTRNAATYYDPNEIELRLSFSAAYTGNLRLYALDWDSTVRRETISVNGQTLALSSSFNQGAWLSYPITVAAGQTVTITVHHIAGANAVLSGIFLGEAGTPPSPTATSAPQGSWVGKVGSEAYDLADWDGTGDVSYLPYVPSSNPNQPTPYLNTSLSLVQGSRYQWAANTTDPRALPDPSGLTRNAGTYFDPNEIQLKLRYDSAVGATYTGNLHLYAVDWDHGGRREIITVNGQSAVLGEFGEGAWLTFPISDAETITITVDRTAGPNAVLSGIFLGEAGAPPGPTVTSSPQGSWVGAVGSAGYDLADWDGAGDVSDLPNASLSLLQGSRYEWAPGTTDVRALEDPGAHIRNAATYYDPNEIKLQLSFTSAHSGELHLYALDWDSAERREVITVNGQSAVLASSFHEGAWLTFPISDAADETVTITVTRLAGANAVLSGIFLGEAGAPPGPTATTAPQGNWVGTYGSAGYDLLDFEEPNDLSSLTNASLTVEQASRYTWASSTTDVRALENHAKTSRVAATYYEPNEIKLKLSFTSAYSGNIELYALDWDSTERREVITVNGQSAVLSSSFHEGAWVSFPISVAAGGTVTITVTRLAGPNAVLSGIFLG